MKKNFILVSFILFSLSLQMGVRTAIAEVESAFASKRELAIHKVVPSAKKVGCFELFELTIDLSATYNNPFDPEDIGLTCHFTLPGGKSISIPGFYYQDFTRTQVDDAERLKKNGPPKWKVRFAGRELGRYSYFITVRDRTGTIKSDTMTFDVVGSDNPGFVRVDPRKSKVYPVFDNGEAFFAVGESIGWAKDKQTYGFDYYFDKLEKNGCNYTRVWMMPWSLSIEWSKKGFSRGDYYGLGVYSLKNSWRLDHILRLAGKKGIYIMLTLGTYGDLMAEKGYWKEGVWKHNPYNAANGGPCKKAKAFWTDEDAKKFYERRLSYILARWGYSTNLLALEFWNELNAPPEWVKEMAEFVKEKDPYDHLLTISLGHFWYEGFSEDEIWALEDIDYTQIHLYGYRGEFRDLVNELIFRCAKLIEKFKKPCLVAEFGIDSSKDDRYYDREGKGVNLHNGLWAATMAGSFGGAINWWWDSYVEPKNLYYHYSALANFVKTVDWLDGDFEDVRVVAPIVKSDKGVTYQDVVLSPTKEWGNMDFKEFFVRNDGNVIGGSYSRFLHGYSKKDLRLTPTFHVNFLKPGKLIMSIGTVSQGGVLHVYIDGNEVWKKDFPVGPEGEGEWKKREYKKEWQIFWANYDRDYEVEVPAGRHVIRLENTGKDWIAIEKITLTDYKSSNYADIRVIGLTRNGEALLWIHNKGRNWYNNYKELEVAPIRDAKFDILEVPDGQYRVEWWDTHKGAITRTEEIQSEEGRLTISVPELSSDISCKILKI